MKIKMKVILVIIALICVPSLSKADTIDVWHVYYNQRLIQDFNAYSANEIVLKMDSIQPGDSITVRYFRDTPCYDCETFLNVESAKHMVFLTSSQKGTFTPISISVDQLLQIKNERYKQPLSVFYFEGKLERRSDKILLFRIRLE